MKQLFIFVCLFAILLFSGCENNKNKKIDKNTTYNQNKQVSQEKPQKITLHCVNGNDITFIKNGDNLKLKDNNSSKIILLAFFATWCPPCKAEIPHLVNLQKKYKKNLQIIAVLLEDEKPDSEVLGFIKYNKINYLVSNGPSDFLLSNLLGGIQNIPFMILYDKDGNVITHYMGIIPEEMIDSDIKKAIKK